jgi:3-oxoacyl-[acyl-carrier protein] reductase
MDLGLVGKTALVTGASRGLGFATALQLANEGAFVLINSRNEENLYFAANKIRNATSSKVIAYAGDLTDETIPGKLVDSVINNFGSLDILITNTGGPPSGSFDSIDNATWESAIQLSFLSQVRLIQAALPHLRNSRSASVLTITSISVKQPVPNLILSNSIRCAMIGLTKSLALELGDQNIRFNSILPSWTDTERVEELMAYRAKMNNTTIDEEIERQSKESPMGRMCSPEEFARAAVFLISPAASYITGVMLPIDGGMYKGTF